MTTKVVVGAQWGDEGKGKVVDVLAAEADLVARFGGGNNAGHTLVVDGKKIITHLVPSGCAYPGTRCLLGTGMVIDPKSLIQEVREIQSQGFLQHDELRVSLDAHIVMPWHHDLDGFREENSSTSLGTTKKGIGPAYEAKTARRGIRIRDLFNPDKLELALTSSYETTLKEIHPLIDFDYWIDLDIFFETMKSWATWFKPMVCDAGSEVLNYYKSGKQLLFEGAQGALLDIDHGTYPYVTSSSTISGGVCAGLGIGPTLIDEVWGITKAYTTRVGLGPFPTKLVNKQGDLLREAGAEYGATTGRPRDCGWLDLPALRLASRRNGFTHLAVTKLDILTKLSDIQICSRYLDNLDPGIEGFENAIPVLDSFGALGSFEEIVNAKTLNELPKPVRAYLDLISDFIEVPISMVSIGPDRDHTIRV